MKNYWDGENWLNIIEDKLSLIYYFDDKVHRNDGPAIIWYFFDGAIESKQYWYNGKIHRKDGPSVIMYDVNSFNILQNYYYNGKIFDPGNLSFEMPIDTEEKELYMRLKYGVIND